VPEAGWGAFMAVLLAGSWSVLCLVWGVTIVGLAPAAPRPLEPRELGGEVVEAERAL